MATDYTAKNMKDPGQHTHLLKRLDLTFDPESTDDNYSRQKGVALRELQDNAIDEIRAGHGKHVKMSFYEDYSFEIKDSGRGIPVDTGVDSDGNPVSGVYLALGKLQSGGKFETDSKRFSSGLNGIGGSATVHVSRAAIVTIYRNKKKYSLHFKDGTPGFFSDPEDPDSDFTELDDYAYVHESKDTRSAEEKKKYPTGTTIKVWLREEVFQSDNPYDDQDIIERFRNTAFLVPDLHGEVYNELNKIENPETGIKEPQSETFHFEDGIFDLVELNQPDEPVHDIVYIESVAKYSEKNVAVLEGDNVSRQSVEREAPVRLAFRYGTGYEDNVSSFVNTINTKLGGVHESALVKALEEAFNERFGSMRGLLKKGDEPPNTDDFREGLTAVLAIEASEPHFKGQSKEALRGREIQNALKSTLVDEFKAWINAPKNKDALAAISTKVVETAKSRQRARASRDLIRQKNKIASSSLPPGLVDCDTAGTEEAELYICEGESAVSAMKAARDSRVNALLGIRGKFTNAQKSNMKSVMDNDVVQSIIQSLGAGSGSDFDIDKMRYGKVFIAVDADPDGGSIAALIYALFWHLFPDVIKQNRLFMLETPLFVFSVKGKNERDLYAKDDRQHDVIVAELEESGEKYSVERFKGLGQVPDNILEETAINPETRMIIQIDSSDHDDSYGQMDALLGNDSDVRKRWFAEIAQQYDLEDVAI